LCEKQRPMGSVLGLSSRNLSIPLLLCRDSAMRKTSFSNKAFAGKWSLNRRLAGKSIKKNGKCRF
ncbi:MAG: hypothetical protein K6B46_01590, partial [Opitutales bacterium]|nr:hypothetical protein [Opitutales bacterium]